MLDFCINFVDYIIERNIMEGAGVAEGAAAVVQTAVGPVVEGLEKVANVAQEVTAPATESLKEVANTVGETAPTVVGEAASSMPGSESNDNIIVGGLEDHAAALRDAETKAIPEQNSRPEITGSPENLQGDQSANELRAGAEKTEKQTEGTLENINPADQRIKEIQEELRNGNVTNIGELNSLLRQEKRNEELKKARQDLLDGNPISKYDQWVLENRATGVNGETTTTERKPPAEENKHPEGNKEEVEDGAKTEPQAEEPKAEELSTTEARLKNLEDRINALSTENAELKQNMTELTSAMKEMLPMILALIQAEQAREQDPKKKESLAKTLLKLAAVMALSVFTEGAKTVVPPTSQN